MVRSRIGIAMALAAIGCGAPARPNGARGARPVARAVERPRPERDPTTPAPEACRAERWERVAVVQGRSATSSTGLRVRYVSATWEHYDDGSFDVMLSLELESAGRATPWLPSGLASPVTIAILDHCVRIVSSTGARLEMDVAARLGDRSTDAP